MHPQRSARGARGGRSDLDTVNVVNPFSYRAYRAVSDYNVPHRFVLNYVWELPSPSGSLRHVLGGWQSSGIWSWQSGFPLSISSGVDNSGSFVGNDLADVASKPQLTSGSRGQKIAKWFTTESFRVNPPAGAYLTQRLLEGMWPRPGGATHFLATLSMPDRAASTLNSVTAGSESV